MKFMKSIKQSIAIILIISNILTSCSANDRMIIDQEHSKKQYSNNHDKQPLPNTFASTSTYEERNQEDQPIIIAQYKLAEVTSTDTENISQLHTEKKEKENKVSLIDKQLQTNSTELPFIQSNIVDNNAGATTQNQPKRIINYSRTGSTIFLEQPNISKQQRVNKIANTTDINSKYKNYTSYLHLPTQASADPPTFKVKGGHQIQFIGQACNEAIVTENVPKPFNRILRLRVVKSNPTINIEYLQAHSITWHQEHMYVCFPEKDLKRKGYVCIEEIIGLQGGGKNPLHTAAQQGKLDIVKALVAAGVDKEAIDDEHLTPLHIAVIYDHLAIVRYLIEEAGAQVEVYHHLGANPLHSAATRGHLPIVKYLLEENRRIFINTKGRTLGTIPLHLAAAYNHPDVVSYLLNKGTIKDARSNKQETPLHLATAKGHIQVVSILVKAGADIHALDETGLTPIEKASAANHFDLIKEIFRAGANVNAIGNDGLTHLHRAIRRGDIQLANLLIELGAGINITDLQHITPLHLVAEKGYTELANRLLNLGADPYAKNKAGLTPLHIGFQIKQIAWIKQLLQNNTFLVLHWAIKAGDIELSKQLLAIGANINLLDQTGWTPLHWATYNGNLSTVKFLIETGNASLSIVNKQGKTPLDLAIQNNHTAVITYIQGLVKDKLAVQKDELHKQLTDYFISSSQQSLQQSGESMGLNTASVTSQEFIHQFVENILDRTQQLATNTTLLQEEDAVENEEEKELESKNKKSIEEKVNALLKGIQEGLQAHAGEIPAVYREAWTNFPVEDLRPQATRLVTEVEQAEEEIKNFKQEQAQKTQVHIQQMEAETQALIKNAEAASQEAALRREQKADKWEQDKQDYRLATSYIAVPSAENFFIPGYRSSNVEGIKEYMQYIREELEGNSDQDENSEKKLIDTQPSEEEPAGKKLSKEQQTDIKEIFKQIKKEREEIKPLYRAMKAHVAQRGGDMISFQQSHELFKKEIQTLQEKIKDVEVAKNLLEELQSIQQELVEILESKGEKLSDYLLDKNGYETHFENDYSDEELIEYVRGRKLIPATIRQQAFTNIFRRYIAARLLHFTEKLGNSALITPEALKNLFQQTHADTQKIIAPVIKKDQDFIDALRENFNEAFVLIMQRLGEESQITTQEFIKILQQIPGSSNYLKDYCATLTAYPVVIPVLDHISGLVLQAIISSPPTDKLVQTIQVKHLNEVKKSIHKLTVAIKKIITQESNLLQTQLD
jgi:ankyrin repeat protein